MTRYQAKHAKPSKGQQRQRAWEQLQALRTEEARRRAGGQQATPNKLPPTQRPNQRGGKS